MRSRANTALDNSMSTPVLQAPDSPDTGLRRERAAIAAQACQTCRNRKSKCDEQRPKCGLCRRLNVDCQYREPQPTKKDKTMVHILETLQRLENKFDNISLPSTTSPTSFRDTTYSSSSHDQQPQHQSSTSSSTSIPPFRDILDAEHRPGNMSRAEPYYERELQRSYHHLTAAHKIILWPAIYLHITNSNLAIAEDLQYVLQDGTPWLIHLELQKHQDALPGPSQRYSIVSPAADSRSNTARPGFAGLSLDTMQRLIDAYFNTFNVIHPLLDRDTFIAEVVTPIIQNGYEDGNVGACLTLLVLSLGQVAIDGVYGAPLSTSPTGEPSGLRGGSIDHPPGLDMFNEARRLIGYSITNCTLENVQIYLLQGTYFEACARHMDFWRSCISASMAIQVLIRCGPVDWSSPRADFIKRAYWTCILDEDLYHLELDLPQTGIQTMEDQVPLPYFHEPRGDNTSVSEEKSHFQYHFLAMIALRRLIARIHQSIHGNSTGRAESAEDYGGPPLHVIKELARQLESWRSLLPQPLQWSDSERHDFPNLNPMSRRPADSLFASDQGPVPINHRFNLDIITGQLRTRFYYAKFMIYRPFVYKALHFPELMTVDDANYCALSMQSACMWPLSMAPPKNKKRLVPHLFTWTQNFVGILLLLRMTTENECLRQICNEKVSRQDMQQTVCLLLDWLRDIKQVDGIAEWSWKILEPLYANGF